MHCKQMPNEGKGVQKSANFGRRHVWVCSLGWPMVSHPDLPGLGHSVFSCQPLAESASTSDIPGTPKAGKKQQWPKWGQIPFGRSAGATINRKILTWKTTWFFAWHFHTQRKCSKMGSLDVSQTHRTKMDCQSVFQAKTQVKCISYWIAFLISGNLTGHIRTD